MTRRINVPTRDHGFRGASAAGARRIRGIARATMALVVAGCASATLAASASAALTHNYLCQITATSPGSASECNSGGSAAPGGFSRPAGITLSGGNLWVASPQSFDPATGTVGSLDEFDSTGAFVLGIPGHPSGGTYFFTGDADSVARNDSTGALYLADSGGPNAIDVFDGSGNFVTQWTGSTTPQGSFGGSAVSVAVDNSGGSSSGDVYVLDAGDQLIDKLDANGNPVTFGASASYISGSELTGTPSGGFGLGQGSANALSVDASGNLYVSDGGNDVVDEFSSSGVFLRSFTGSGAQAGSFGGGQPVAVDGASGDVYSAGGLVTQFSSTGGYLGQFNGAGTPAGSFNAAGVAVDASGNVYVSDSANSVVDKFGPAVVVPDVSTGQATGVATTGATLNGTVNADSTTVTECGFEYVDQADYSPSSADPYSAGQMAQCPTPFPSGSNPTAVAAQAAVQPGTTYHFRLVAANSNGTNFGADATFTTSGPPTIDGQSATVVDTSSEDVTAEINPHGLDTTYHVEYGPSDCATSSCSSFPVPDADIGSGITDVSVKQRLTGLSAGATYHYRLVATNSAGPPVAGPDQTFVVEPNFAFQSFSSTFANRDGTPNTQAGSHPWAQTVSFSVPTFQDASGNVKPVENVKTVAVNLPVGFAGNPTATPQCPQSELVNTGSCPTDTQVGTFTVDDTPGGTLNVATIPLYSMVPPPGEPARFGVHISTSPQINVFIDVKIRTGSDYGVTATASGIADGLPIVGTTVTLWGVPADPSHDAQRGQSCSDTGCTGGGVPSGSALVPLLTMPTSCTGPLTTTASADSWQHIGSFVTASSTTEDQTGTPVGMNGCNRLDFSPSISARPDASSADAPAGFDFDLSLPASGLLNPNGLAEAGLKKAVVTLPAGLSLNPASAQGLEGCSPQQISLSDASEPSCPDASKVATAQITTPVLPDPLTGSVFLAQQSNNPFGALIAGYLVAQGDGVLVKLPGKFDLNQQTGQITASFDNNPQLPFTDLKLHFFGGDRGEVATPQTCGTFATTSDLTPWSSPGDADATPSDQFTIDSNCNPGFAPSFIAGTEDPQAGAFSPFVLTLQRSDTDQNLQGLAVKLPPGLLAKLAGVGQCSERQLASISSQPGTGAQEAANPSCPAGSQVGTVQTGAGVGPDPFVLKGRVYLTGPYEGAPYGLAVVVPALAGPLDLGTVVVRQRLEIDPSTAQVTDVSDPFPTILDGIPLRLRRVDVSLDRPDFTLNPTSCNPMAVNGTISSTEGATAPVSSRFQVGGCSGLGFSPRLSATILNGGQGIHRSDHPNLQVNLHANPGEANVRRVEVTLPPSFQIDQANLGNICSETELAQTRCAGRNTVGTARATTPLLDYPLSGPVYAVSGSGGLPRLAVILNGPASTPLQLILRGDTTTLGNRIQNTFATVPDAPVTDFSLTLNGGPGGYLVDNTNVCQGVKGKGPKALRRARKLRRTDLTAGAQIDGQNGKTADQTVPILARCAPLKKHHRRHRHH